MLGDQFDAQLAGIDVNTAEGRAAYHKFLQDLFVMFETGFFTANPDQLTGNVDDYIRIANDSADAIAALGGAASDAVSQLTNVPKGFKVALAEFNATLDQRTDQMLKNVLRDGPLFEGLPLNRPGDGASLPLPGAGASFRDVIMHITQQPGEDTDAFAERVVEKLRTRARGQSSDTLVFPSL